MKNLIVAGPELAFELGFASPPSAFSCPGHFTDAQAAIDDSGKSPAAVGQ
jgi:hypothetical protein